jgi:hypothetical protein
LKLPQQAPKKRGTLGRRQRVRAVLAQSPRRFIVAQAR